MNSVGFETAFERVIGHEGGFQDGAGDRGNWTSGKVGVGELRGTKYGISAMSYPRLDIKNMTVDTAKAIYKRDWWEPMQMAAMPSSVQYQLFDAAINHGMRNATKMLQRAVMVKDDGIVGPRTIAAVTGADHNDVLMRFLAERLEFFTHVGTWQLYGRGWARRIAGNLRLAAEDN